MTDDRRWDRFDLELFCQHCGQYLTTLVGVDRKSLSAARDAVRQAAQAHANAVGRTVEVTYSVTLQRAVFVEPQPPSD